MIRVGRHGDGKQVLAVDLKQHEEEQRPCRPGLPLAGCRMMDQLDARAINHLRTRVGEASRSLLPEPVAILFFDCTTLYFETAVEDALRQHGFGKDGKHKDSQVLLALMVTREGLPIGYAICRPRCRSRFLRPTHTPRWRARGTGGSAH
ncbi:MAG: hypothetical protein OXD42_01075, partial [Rhodospirillaceae bacterium]|nr:hypothetical protein [Rhodospirillaceae bacterium]